MHKDREQRLAYLREKHRKAREELLSNGACFECGSTEDLVVHDRTKKLVRCRSCMNKAMRISPNAHGVTMYNKYGCRCDICKNAHREAAKRYAPARNARRRALAAAKRAAKQQSADR